MLCPASRRRYNWLCYKRLRRCGSKCDCPNVKNADPERLVSVHWEGYDNGYFATSLVDFRIQPYRPYGGYNLPALAAMRIALHSMSSKKK